MDTQVLENHTLADVLGRGAFGVVYRGLNWLTGETVAVKQIGLSNIPKSELPEIMSEIDLLKNLDHPNIVQYRGSKRTKEFLFIILEYCENGSLHSICKKFGKFPEHLVAQYICQVLDGLLYLHDQGVIHRDIKASNILATKEGGVKLADFGVATRTGPLKDSAVVGSPYWMAPEVIDQSGATTASDIWSVGAVVIELLEGRPPYCFLEPMLALFRIVNDDCPPLPESASPIARDFMLQCFQKDYNLRISARKLLRHPWMVAARKRLDHTKREQNSPRVPKVMNAYDETVHKVQEWNKALEYSTTKATRFALKQPTKASEEVANVLQTIKLKQPHLNSTLNGALADAVDSAGVKSRSRADSLSLPASLVRQPSIALPAIESAEDDNWDRDFEEGIPQTKIAGLEDAAAAKDIEEDFQGSDDFSQTLKPAAASRIAQRTVSSRSTMQPILEDYSDLVPDENVFKGRVASLKTKGAGPRKILHPRDISNSSSIGSTDSNSCKTVKPSLPAIASPPPVSSILSDRAQSTPKTVLSAFKSSLSHSSSTTSIDRYSETEDEVEDFSDLIGKDTNADTANLFNPALRLSGRLSGRSWLGDDESDEDDVFAEEDFLESNGNTENMARDRLARISGFVQKLVEDLPDEEISEVELTEKCFQLISFFDEDVESKKIFARAHGILAAIDALQLRESPDLLSAILRVVNSMVEHDGETLEKICLIGGCSVVICFASNKYCRDIRLEAALFIGSVCRTSLLTLQMFISCRGLQILVEMIDEDYLEQHDLIWMAVEGLCRVFEMQGTTSRTDFCRILATEGVLLPLAEALLNSAEDDDELAESAKIKICSIFHIFAQSDLKVKESMAVRPVISRLVKALDLLQGDLLVTILKTIRGLTMSSKALEVLQNADVIQVLVRIMKDHLHSSYSTEIANPVVTALFNLCRLSKSRQEEAATSGATSVLIDLANTNSPLKQFALPILCDFAQNGKLCRKLLWLHDGLEFLLDLLRDPYWSVSALESIQSWLADETARVEDVLLKANAVDALMKAFGRSKAATFENILEPLLKILRVSTNLSLKLSSQIKFLERILDRLSTHAKAVVRLNLLRVIKVLHEATNQTNAPLITAIAPKIEQTISVLADSDPAVLVREMAKELSRELRQKPPLSSLRRSLSGLGNVRRSNSSGSVLSLSRSQRSSAKNGLINKVREGDDRRPTVHLRRSHTQNLRISEPPQE